LRRGTGMVRRGKERLRGGTGMVRRDKERVRWTEERRTRTHPLAIAPTNTAIECVSGKVGRNWDNRIVGASADRAERQCQFWPGGL